MALGFDQFSLTSEQIPTTSHQSCLYTDRELTAIF